MRVEPMSAADVVAETFCHASMMTEHADSLTTLRLRSRLLVESREQPAPGRPIEQSRDLMAIAGLVGPDRRLGLGREDAFNRPRVKPKRAQVLLCDLEVAGGQDCVRRRLYGPRLLGQRGDTSGQ